MIELSELTLLDQFRHRLSVDGAELTMNADGAPLDSWGQFHCGNARCGSAVQRSILSVSLCYYSSSPLLGLARLTCLYDLG